MNFLPLARSSNLVVQDLGRELLVYDLQTNQAFTLNETLMIVFNSCNGKTSFDELERRYKFTKELIHLALAELKANELLENYESDHFKGLSRREVIKRVGLASMSTLPIVSALIAPQAADAASSCPDLYSSDIPNGCRVGSAIGFSSSCSRISDSDKNSLCDGTYDNFCASGRAGYARGSCTDIAMGSQFTCVCAA